MSIIQNIISCMRGYRSDAYRSKKLTKIKFGIPLSKLSRKSCSHLPKPLFDLLVYLAQEGVKINDLFRRPGNAVQIKEIIDLLSHGEEIQWRDYNIYTAANVVKKYFISLPGGIFGKKFEVILLASYSQDEDARRSTFHRILRQLPNANREMAILMFGILFRMVSHAVDEHSQQHNLEHQQYEQQQQQHQQHQQLHQQQQQISHNQRYVQQSSGESMSAAAVVTATATARRLKKDVENILAEAVAKSVAGSMFHMCTYSPDSVERASQVLQGLILDFPSFEESYVDFYYRSTMMPYRTDNLSYFSYSLSQKDKCTEVELEEENSFPSVEVPIFTVTNPYGDVQSVSADSSPILTKKAFGDNCDIDDISLGSSRSTGFDRVQERQLQQLRIRSDWFLQQSSCSELSRSVNSSQHNLISNSRFQRHQTISVSNSPTTITITGGGSHGDLQLMSMTDFCSSGSSGLTMASSIITRPTYSVNSPPQIVIVTGSGNGSSKSSSHGNSPHLDASGKGRGNDNMNFLVVPSGNRGPIDNYCLSSDISSCGSQAISSTSFTIDDDVDDECHFSDYH